jgi:hypothetical protein
MSLYYFHIFDGRDLIDADGVELPDEATAKLEAVRLTGLALSDDADCLLRRRRWTLDVTDALGHVLFHIAVHASDRRITADAMP